MQKFGRELRITVTLDKINWQYALFLTAQLARSSAGLKNIAILDSIMTVIQIYCFLTCFWRRIRKGRFSVLDISIIGFYMSLLVSTILVSRDFVSWGTYTLQGIGSVFLIEDMLLKDEYKGIAIIRNVSFVFILCNLISVIIAPGEFFDGYFFLGSRIGFTPFCIFAVVASMAYDFINKSNKISFFSFVTILTAVLNLTLQNVATGLLGLLLLIVMLIAGNFICKFGMYKLNYILAFLLPLTAWVIIVLAGNTDIVQNLLTFVGRDATFSGRTIIWNTAIGYILEKRFFGYGVTALGEFYIDAYVNGRSLPAHDELLNLLYQGGIAAFICWNILFIITGRALFKCKDRYVVPLMSAMIFSFSCIMITEIQSQKAVIFLAIALAYQLGINHTAEVRADV